jgi:uncharacterized protein YegL
MPRQDLTEIVVLLDRSGSMQAIRSDMEGGFNRFIEEQRRVPVGECLVTLVQFDTESVDTVYEARTLDTVPPLSLSPRGRTPLLDATAATILRTGARFGKQPDAMRPGRVLFLIITDGIENASTLYSTDQVRGMIEHQRNVYKWEFVYLGANVDAFTQAGSIGIAIDQAANFAANAGGVNAMFAVASANIASYRSGGQFAYTSEQRDRMVNEPTPVETKLTTTTTENSTTDGLPTPNAGAGVSNR